ncbi:inactive pancreatic lipase-related protein 1 [Trichonephila clavipes]|nr:inactive pancreatic lipase-related protein 1 [Trichonephila clavipes]
MACLPQIFLCKRFSTLKQGLDPAGPYFEDTDPKVRLDPSDALFVDVIHTDSPPAAQVAGMLQPAGHLDFYPTPGWRRTGCSLLDGKYTIRNKCVQSLVM